MWNRTTFHVLSDAVVNGMKECIRDQGNRIAELESDVETWRERYVGMRECIRDQGNRIAELEADVEAWRERYTDTSKQLDAARDAGKMVVEELSETLAEERAEADLFHAAYVGMCTMQPTRALSIGHSQQEH